MYLMVVTILKLFDEGHAHLESGSISKFPENFATYTTDSLWLLEPHLESVSPGG